MTKSKSYGILNVEKRTEEVIPLGNGYVVRFDTDAGGRISKIRMTNANNVDIVAPAHPAIFVQLAEVIKIIDPNERFSCAKHGTYRSMEGSRQPPKCEKCLFEDTQAVSRSRSLVRDEE